MNTGGCGRYFVSPTNSAMTDQLVPAPNVPGGDLNISLDMIPCPDRAGRPYAVSACGPNGDHRTRAQSAPWIGQDLSLACPSQFGTCAPPNPRNAMSTKFQHVPPLVHLRWLLLSGMTVLTLHYHAILAVILNTLLRGRSIASAWWNAQFHEWRIIWWPTRSLALIRRVRTLPWFVKPRPPPACRNTQP